MTNLTIHLINSLGSDPPSVAQRVCTCGNVTLDGDAIPASSYKDPNVTNLHLHGMHVDPNAEPITARVQPGHSRVYSYTVGARHHTGTAWY